jgi:hypothetical protein
MHKAKTIKLSYIFIKVDRDIDTDGVMFRNIGEEQRINLTFIA